MPGGRLDSWRRLTNDSTTKMGFTGWLERSLACILYKGYTDSLTNSEISLTILEIKSIFGQSFTFLQFIAEVIDVKFSLVYNTC